MRTAAAWLTCSALLLAWGCSSEDPAASTAASTAATSSSGQGGATSSAATSASGGSTSASGGAATVATSVTTGSGGAMTPVDDVSYFVFGHSLFTWDAQVEPGSEAESSTGYWLGYIANESGTQSAGVGQFGQLSYHAIPPIPNYGYSTNAYDPWPDGAFADRDFSHVVVMPSNFEQTSLTPAQYMPDTERVLDYVVAQEPTAEIILYEHWPEPPLSGSVVDSANLTAQEWAQYNTYTRGAYHDWFVDWQNLIAANYPSATVRMVPLGPVIADLLDESYMSTVAYTDLYADDAPHGRRTAYFLAALICYRALFRQNPSFNSALPNGQIVPEVANNLADVVTFIDGRLAAYQQSGVRVY